MRNSSTEGYTGVCNTDFDDGVWTAKADSPAGKYVAAHMDPQTGRIIGYDRQ